MSKKPSIVRVAMAKKVATSWLLLNSAPEYRVTVYPGGNIKNLPSLLRAHRDGRKKIASIPKHSGLGLRVFPDRMSVWSKHRETMVALDSWLMSQDFETSGVW